MRKFALAAALLVLFAFTQTAHSEALTVFAAASLQASLETISHLYTAHHIDTQIIFSFESSGTLKTQIQEGADCDIFISAA